VVYYVARTTQEVQNKKEVVTMTIRKDAMNAADYRNNPTQDKFNLIGLCKSF